jgi:hypothetical protein
MDNTEISTPALSATDLRQFIPGNQRFDRAGHIKIFPVSA